MNVEKNKLAMINTLTMQSEQIFNLSGDMSCCVVTQNDKYLLVCTSNNDNENEKPIKRG
jgi:hypothetical protein